MSYFLIGEWVNKCLSDKGIGRPSKIEGYLLSPDDMKTWSEEHVVPPFPCICRNAQEEDGQPFDWACCHS
jgi:hypothetical protein